MALAVNGFSYNPHLLIVVVVVVIVVVVVVVVVVIIVVVIVGGVVVVVAVACGGNCMWRNSRSNDVSVGWQQEAGQGRRT
ncbi:unnamed protein product [Onchocerca ochengi]|uniref:Transmembrane protein n=1 Tax=Onchocerca ochengi TaxID=42157 RepID=A0A182DYD7_ONCOC|nr:unnamed protein product [Onchocerca ochengi]